MAAMLSHFEALVRKVAVVSPSTQDSNGVHPFEQRNVYHRLPRKVRTLFDDGHYAESTFAAFKFLDKRVQKLSRVSESGFKLMMAAFDPKNPLLRLSSLSSTSELDEQSGFRFMFAGSFQGIRNPRGHEHAIVDDPDICLDHLSLISLLLRRLDGAGYP